MRFDSIQRVTALYAAVDARIARVQCLADIRCPPGCGTCCQSPNVEASVLELLPVALELCRSGEIDALLEAAERTDRRTCVFHTPGELQYGHGRCAVYPHRPIMCRLFGYSAVRDKNGRPTLVTCSLVNRLVPDSVAAARESVAKGAEIPIMADVASELRSIDPPLGSTLLPINQAFSRAVERIGLALRFAGVDSEIEPEPDDPIRPSPAAA